MIAVNSKVIGVAGMIGAAGLLMGCTGGSKVKDASWEGKGGGDTLSGTSDTGTGAWEARVSRMFQSDVNLTGSSSGTGTAAVTARDRTSGGHAQVNVTAPGTGAGGIVGAISGVRATSTNGDKGKTQYSTEPFNAGIEGSMLVDGSWSAKFDVPWAADWKASGKVGADEWSLDISRPGNVDIHLKGSGPVTVQQQVAAVAAYMING